MHEWFDLSGRVALVTGGNRGIGRAIALGLAGAGARVVVAARDEEKSAATVQAIKAAGGEAVAVHCDVTDRASIDAAVGVAEHTYGGLAILVNNAGISGGGPAAEIREEIWDRVVDTNLKGSFQMAQAAHRLLRREGGKVINLASEYSLFGSAFVLPYSASKGGVVQLTKSLAIAWAPDRIQVNALIPGWIRTDMTAPVERIEAFHRSIVQRTPAGRFGEPAELAGAAIFLASRASDFVTGIVLPVDGGYAAA
jgi:2-dehydro-3-deoxy-D-gluconate 5-dehydrogenase